MQPKEVSKEISEDVVVRQKSPEFNPEESIYIKQIKSNLEKNSEEGIYVKDNVYSVHGFCRDTRKNFKKSIFINPGPTLDHHVEELQEVTQDEDTLVFCSDVCLPGLTAAGINVDVVVTLDPSEKTALFIQDSDVEFDVVAASCSPIHKYYSKDRDFYLYNSVEETKDMNIPGNQLNHPANRFQLQKSTAVNSLLQEVGIYSKYTQFLARGTVAVTMYQLMSQIKNEGMFYGFDFYIEEEKPYADFISEGVYEAIKDKVKIGSLKKYKKAVIKSYYEGDDSKDAIENSIKKDKDGNEYSVPPLLQKYQLLFYRYAQIDKFNGKSLRFR